MLYALGEVPVGRSVRELLERFASLSGQDASFLMNSARELDRHYVPSRYPNALPSGTPHEAYDEPTARRAIACAEEVLAFARQFLRGLGL